MYSLVFRGSGFSGQAGTDRQISDLLFNMYCKPAPFLGSYIYEQRHVYSDLNISTLGL